MGSFEPIPKAADVIDPSSSNAPWLGHRMCPNPDCRAHVFVIHASRKLLASYPPQRIDFDPKNIPEAITASLNEAITCHAESCFTASAIMVRKTLEELCADQEVEGDDLYSRIESLQEKVLLPKQLMSGLQELRLLGNDAAHVEAKVFDDIGEEEVVLAIDVTKEILKGVYQVGDLVERLRARQQSPGTE
jgi:hypothetical protein